MCRKNTEAKNPNVVKNKKKKKTGRIMLSSKCAVYYIKKQDSLKSKKLVNYLIIWD